MQEGVHDSPVLCTFWCSSCVLHIVGKTYISNTFSNPVMSGEVRSFESSFSLSSSALDGSTGNPPESLASRTRKGSERMQFTMKTIQMEKLSFPITKAFFLQLSSVSERFSLSLSSLRVSDHRSTRVHREFARVFIGYITFAQPRRCIFVWFPVWNLLRRGPNLPGENSLVSLLVVFGARFFLPYPWRRPLQLIEGKHEKLAAQFITTIPTRLVMRQVFFSCRATRLHAHSLSIMDGYHHFKLLQAGRHN